MNGELNMIFFPVFLEVIGIVWHVRFFKFYLYFHRPVILFSIEYHFQGQFMTITRRWDNVLTSAGCWSHSWGIFNYSYCFCYTIGVFPPTELYPIHYSLHFIQQSDESVELLNDLCRSTPFKIPMFTNLHLVWFRVIYLTDGQLKSKVICYRIWIFHSPKYFTTSLERLGKRWYNRAKKWYEENILFLQE